jgi:hypothetical protein
VRDFLQLVECRRQCSCNMRGLLPCRAPRSPNVSSFACAILQAENRFSTKRNRVRRLPIVSFAMGNSVFTCIDAVRLMLTVPDHLQEFIYACQQGNIDVVRHLWDPDWLDEFNKLKREDTCHPLLTAVHHLRPAVVEFLCEQVRDRLDAAGGSKCLNVLALRFLIVRGFFLHL